MKFTADKAQGNIIKSFNPGEIVLQDRTLTAPAIISVDTIIADWQPAPIAELAMEDFSAALEMRPDIILFGTGTRQQFPDMRLMTEIMRSGVAIEIMHSDAACRTYNVLVGENRAAVVALLVD